MKKNIFLIMLIGLLVSLCACGSVQPGTEETEELQEESTQVVTEESEDLPNESAQAESGENDSVSISMEQDSADLPEVEWDGEETTGGLTQKQKEAIEKRKAAEEKRNKEKIQFISDYVSDKAVLCQSTEGVLAFQVEKRKLPNQWTEQGEVEFEVRGTEVQFHNENYDIEKDALEANIKQALGKAVGQDFLLEHERHNPKDGTYSNEIYRYVILEIKKSTVLGNRKETVEYGDILRAICYKAEVMEQNTEYMGAFQFQVEDGIAEFVHRDAIFHKQLMEKIEKELLKYEYRVYDEEYAYYIKETPVSELAGKTVQGYCYRKKKQSDGEREFLGSFWLKCNLNSTEVIKNKEIFSEEILREIKKLVVENLDVYGWQQEIYDTDYCYSVMLTTIIDEESKPSFTIPEGWGYQFDAPKIGSFKGYDWDISASAIDMEGGEVFGYEDRLSDGCSTWCGCYSYYCEATVSSSLPAQGTITYGVENLNDAYRMDAWAEGVPGDGIGETFEIREMYLGTGDEVFRYNEMCIVNGYAKDETTWQENNRVKSLKLYFFDEYMGTITLEDTMLPQYVDLSPVAMRVRNGCEAKFRFEIADVYKGTKYDDTCISGIVVEFEGRHAH